MKVLKSWTDGYGCRVLLKHDPQSGRIRICDETPGRKSWGITFLPQELEELASLIQQSADANRESGVHPHQRLRIVKP